MLKLFWRSDLSRVAGVCLFLLGCVHSYPEDLARIETLQTHLANLSPAQNTAQTTQEIGCWIAELTALEEKYAARETLQHHLHDLLRTALVRYQYHYFLAPNETTCQALTDLYDLWDRLAACACTPPAALAGESHELRTTIEYALRRGETYGEHWLALLDFLADARSRQALFTHLRQTGEIGGVIFISPQYVRVLIIPDESHGQREQYLAQFRQNDFRTLPLLQKDFLEWLALRQVGADETTRYYLDLHRRLAQESFAAIAKVQQLWQENSLPPEMRESHRQTIEEHKARLDRLGLDKTWFAHTYSFDRARYSQRDDTAFFFHTHPYTSTIDYAKKPSGQDLQMSFRLGASLIFDVQQEWIDVYCVVLGKIRHRRRFH